MCRLAGMWLTFSPHRTNSLRLGLPKLVSERTYQVVHCQNPAKTSSLNPSDKNSLQYFPETLHVHLRGHIQITGKKNSESG